MAIVDIAHLGYSVRTHLWSQTKQILNDVTLTVAAGEIFGFLGPNGAGKTTTIRAMLGLITPQAGTVRIDGGEPADPKTRARLGYTPERAYFPEHLSGREVLLMHAALAGMSFADARRAADEALEQVGMTHAQKDRLRGYSKGMLQRIGLAQALLARPKLVIMDEPMSGLDPLGRKDVRSVMLSLRAAGTTVFFSTHILPDVESICDRVAILVRGQVRRVGHLHELLGNTVEHVEVHVAAAMPGGPPTTLPAQATAERHGELLVVRCPTLAIANELIDSLRAQRVNVLAVIPHQRSLEEVFVEEAGSHASF